MNSVKHWGEILIPAKSQDASSHGVEDFYIPEQLMTESLKLYPPCGMVAKPIGVLTPEHTQMDSTIVHTILLIQHAKKVQSLLNIAKRQTDSNRSMENAEMEESEPLPPPVPELPKKEMKYNASFPTPCKESEISTFSLGIGCPPPEITLPTARCLLRKSVAALLAHAGYDTSSELVLSFLTDVAHDYIQKMTRLLRIAVDRESMTGTSGFPDVMEKVFHEMRIGSIRSLHNYYQTRVIRYHQKMLKTCQELVEEYEKVQQPTNQPVVSGDSFRLKTEEAEDEDVPEIHFPALGDGEGEELQPSLETGFQMLQSLEQETQSQLQNLERDEEMINVSDSPSQSGQEVTLHIPENSNVPVVEAVQASSSSSSVLTSGKGKKKRKKASFHEKAD